MRARAFEPPHSARARCVLTDLPFRAYEHKPCVSLVPVHFIPIVQIVRIFQINIPVHGGFVDDRCGKEIPAKRQRRKGRKGIERKNSNQKNFAVLRLYGKSVYSRTECRRKGETEIYVNTME